MFETSLVDGDILVYRAALACKDEEEDLACWQAGEMMRRILHETNCMLHKCYLSGGVNFRYDINPEYKANRRDVPKPKHYEAVRAYLVTEWQASVTDGIEADDALGIEQSNEEGTIICSIDKDLLQVPGWHYNFVRKEQRLVSPLDGIKHFYYQLIMGDKADNIFGYDGKARDKLPKFLEPLIDDLYGCNNELDMFHLVKDVYDSYDRMLMNAHCLYIQRKENDKWVPPDERVDGGTTQGLHHLSTEGGEPTLSTEVRDSERSKDNKEN